VLTDNKNIAKYSALLQSKADQISFRAYHFRV